MEKKPDAESAGNQTPPSPAVPRAEYELLHAKYLRAHADFENTKKRHERERLDTLRYAKEEFVAEFMPILDSIEMASRHIDSSNGSKALKEGLAMIDAQIKKFLKGLGVEKVKTVGEKFDPHMHEAVEAMEADDKEENIIIEEMKAGYTLNGKLIRPAAVKIVKHGPQSTVNGPQ